MKKQINKIISGAKKTNWKFEEAEPELTQVLEKAIFGLLWWRKIRKYCQEEKKAN